MAHVTNGAPPVEAEARADGFSSPDEYAAARCAELANALDVLPRQPEQFTLSFRDQMTASQLPQIATEVRRLIQEWRPTVVLTHPYEGGHPDHDSTALAAAVAVVSSGR